MAEQQPEKITVVRRDQPTWVVYAFTVTSILLFFLSLVELPGHFDDKWYGLAFGIFKVVLWGLMSWVFIKESIKRIKIKETK